jgi:hypothetical protein
VRKFLRILLLWTGWGLWMLLWLELGLQLFYYATAGQFLFRRIAVPMFAPNPYSGFFNKPNLSYGHRTSEFQVQIYTNSLGLRIPRPGVEYSRIPLRGTFRILLLGPSFAFGWGVDYSDTVAARLETLLGPCVEGRSKVEVIDAGVPSLPPLPQLKWFTRIGSSFKPDLIIQFIYGSLNVGLDDGSWLFVDREGYLERSDLGTAERLLAAAKNSALVFYGWTLYTELLAARENNIAGAGRELHESNRFTPDSPDVKVSLQYYRRLKQAAHDAGSSLLVVYFPLSYYVHRKDIARWRHLGVADNVDAEIAADRDFCDYLNGIGIACLNITADLVKAATENPDRLYYWLDIHWTRRGNLMAAKSIGKYLNKRLVHGCASSSEQAPSRAVCASPRSPQTHVGSRMALRGVSLALRAPGP